MADATDLCCAQADGHEFQGNLLAHSFDLCTRVIIRGPIDALGATVVDHVLKRDLIRGWRRGRVLF